MTLTETCKRFLKHCESAISLSEHTLKAYRSDLADAATSLGQRKPLDAIQKDDLRRYIRDLREVRNFKETTIKRRLASMKLMFRWASQEEGILGSNPFDFLNERIRLPRRLPKALDRGDRQALRKAVALKPQTDDWNAIRSKTAIHLMLETGIRVGELVAINVTDLSITSGQLVIHGKGNRQRLVYLLQKPLNHKIAQYLARRSAIATRNEKMFVKSDGTPISTPQVRLALKETARVAGISRHVTPHMLRHTCATQWLESGLDIRHVQKLLGHQSISTTEIYTHVSDQGLREALERVAHDRRR